MFGTVQQGAAVSITAPSGTHIQNAGGTTDEIDFSISGGGPSGVIQNGVPLDCTGQAGNTITVAAYGDTTGGSSPTGWRWGITVVDNSAGLISSAPPTPPTTQNWTGMQFTIAGSISSGMVAIFELSVEASNSAGNDSATFEVLFLVP